MALKKRQKCLLAALQELGGQATTGQIAEKARLPINGISQSLGALTEWVRCLGGRGKETKWQLIGVV